MPRPERPYNFSAGPAILPAPVFSRTAAAIEKLAVEGDDSLESSLSILEISHRSKTYDAIHEEAIALCHDVIGIPRTHKVLFLQGGASTQFCMVPMNLRGAGKAAYIDTGAWSAKAIAEAQMLGETEVIATSKASGYDHIPALPDASTYAGAAYLHLTTNNTIYGTEWSDLPKLAGDVPLVVDMSSNIASRPMAMDNVAMGYAGAQKNLGPSGVTVVFIREDMLARKPTGVVPTMLRYATHASKNSLFNTPNTFGIMVLRNVLSWVADQGGVEAVGAVNRRKADTLYAVLDGSSLYKGHARVDSRSTMNVPWTLDAGDDEASAALTKRFLAEAQAQGLSGLKGHRSVGGCRASIYNAFPEVGVEALCAFMTEFERTA